MDLHEIWDFWTFWKQDQRQGLTSIDIYRHMDVSDIWNIWNNMTYGIFYKIQLLKASDK